MSHLLVVEDEEKLARFIELELKHDGYEVSKSGNGREALEMALENDYDLILLDIMLPELNGLEVMRRLSREKSVPVILLTARDAVMDKVSGLDAGAVDYITKPFNILEVKARIKAILRRNGKVAPEKDNSRVLETKGLKIDLDSRRVYIDGEEVNLTAKEFDLIYRTVDVHVRRLREKIEAAPATPKYVHTKWGVGYYFS